MAVLDAMLDWKEYTALSSHAKEELTREIGRENGMEWKRMRSFSRWGQELETAIYQADGASFVFVPGKEVMLGWRGLPEGKGEEEKEFLDALSEDVEEYWGGQFEPGEIIGLLPSPGVSPWSSSGQILEAVVWYWIHFRQGIPNCVLQGTKMAAYRRRL